MSQRIKTSSLYYALLAIFLLGAALTNPSPEKHRKAVKDRLEHYLTQYTEQSTQKTSQNTWEKLGKSLGASLGFALMEPLVHEVVQRENFVVFSLTKVDWDGKSNTIGIGLFGKVFLSPKIDDTLQKMMEKAS